MSIEISSEFSASWDHAKGYVGESYRAIATWAKEHPQTIQAVQIAAGAALVSLSTLFVWKQAARMTEEVVQKAAEQIKNFIPLPDLAAILSQLPEWADLLKKGKLSTDTKEAQAFLQAAQQVAVDFRRFGVV